MWTLELAMGLLLLSSTWTMGGDTAYSTNRIDDTMCVDLAILYTNGASVQEFVQLYYEGWDIAGQNTPFEKGEGVICHAERIENGILKPIFIRIR